MSTFAALYFRLEKIYPKKNQAELFFTAWQSRLFFDGECEDLNINVAWYVIRDIKTNKVLWYECGCCKTQFVDNYKQKTLSSCPFCSGAKVRAIKA